VAVCDRAIDQFGQVIDVFVSLRRDITAARRFFERAIGTTRVTPVEVVTDQAATYPVVLDELLPAAWHRTEQYVNNRVECDHGRLKARRRPMRGLKQDHSARVIIAGHAFVQNLRRGITSWRSRSWRTGGWRSRSPSWALAIRARSRVAASPCTGLPQCNSAWPDGWRGGAGRRSPHTRAAAGTSSRSRPGRPPGPPTPWPAAPAGHAAGRSRPQGECSPAPAGWPAGGRDAAATRKAPLSRCLRHSEISEVSRPSRRSSAPCRPCPAARTPQGSAACRRPGTAAAAGAARAPGGQGAGPWVQSAPEAGRRSSSSSTGRGPLSPSTHLFQQGKRLTRG
jgi:DDE domain